MNEKQRISLGLLMRCHVAVLNTKNQNDVFYLSFCGNEKNIYNIFEKKYLELRLLD
jgi:hypothetical protein